MAQIYKNPLDQAENIKKLTKRDLTNLVRTPNKFKTPDEVLAWIDSFKPEELDFEMNDDHKADIIDDWTIYVEHPDWNW